MTDTIKFTIQTFRKISFLSLLLLLFFSGSVSAQVAGKFDIITLKWRWGSKTNDYLKSNGFTTNARIMGHPVIYGSGSSSRANLTSVREWLAAEFPTSTSTGYLIISWETGPYPVMQKYSATSSEFKAAESEVLRLLNEVKRFRPNVKVSMYMMPYRFWLQNQNTSYNGTGKFDNIFAKVDFIAPSYYILQADEEVGHDRNLQYIRENLQVALTYGKRFNKPVIPFMWHKIHPNLSDRYAGEIIQKEVFAKYIDYIANYSYNNYKAAGVWWYDGLSGQLKDLSGIKNCLAGTVYDKATYDAMIVDYAQRIKSKLSSSMGTTRRVVSFTLVNADTDRDIMTLNSGATLNLASLPTRNLNIRANTSTSTIGSVKFVLNGQQSKSLYENGAPYALYGGTATNYNGWVPALGNYTLKATPYSLSSGGGTAGTSLTVSFTVISKAVTSTLATALDTNFYSEDLNSDLAADLNTDQFINEEPAGSTPEEITSHDSQAVNVSVYPNPVATTLNVQIDEAGEGKCSLSLYNLFGKVVQTKSIEKVADRLNTTLEVGSLASGRYVLQVITPNGIRKAHHIMVE